MHVLSLKYQTKNKREREREREEEKERERMLAETVHKEPHYLDLHCVVTSL